jgi:hypothetical protein
VTLPKQRDYSENYPLTFYYVAVKIYFKQYCKSNDGKSNSSKLLESRRLVRADSKRE